MYWSTCFAIRKDLCNFLELFVIIFHINLHGKAPASANTWEGQFSPPSKKLSQNHLKFHPLWLIRNSQVLELKSTSSIGLAKIRKFSFPPSNVAVIFKYTPSPHNQLPQGIRHLNTEWAFPRGPGIHPEVSPWRLRDGMPTAHQNWCLQSLSKAICEHNTVKKKRQNKDFC